MYQLQATMLEPSEMTVLSFHPRNFLKKFLIFFIDSRIISIISHYCLITTFIFTIIILDC